MACNRAVFFLSHRSVRIATLSRSTEHSSQERGLMPWSHNPHRLSFVPRDLSVLESLRQSLSSVW